MPLDDHPQRRISAPGERNKDPQDIAIVVVDGARFSSTIIAMLADWNMAAMSGLELTRRVRGSEPAGKHRTHIAMLTSGDETDELEDAIKAGVDEFINKEQVRTLLHGRILAARQLSQRQNELLKENTRLKAQIQDLRTTDVIDPTTGLGNLKFTLARMGDLTKEVEARGGAACVLLVGLANLTVIRAQHDDETIDELITGFAAKVRNLVRPLDVVTRPEPGILAVSMRQPSAEACSSHSFKRIFDNLYMHSFKTSQGYIPVVVGVGICVADETTGLPESRNYLRAAYDVLMRSYDTGVITVANYSPEQAESHLSLWS